MMAGQLDTVLPQAPAFFRDRILREGTSTSNVRVERKRAFESRNNALYIAYIQTAGSHHTWAFSHFGRSSREALLQNF